MPIVRARAIQRTPRAASCVPPPAQPRKRSSPVARGLATGAALAVLAAGGLAATELGHGQSMATHPTAGHVVFDGRR
jgi:hypothetical protein